VHPHRSTTDTGTYRYYKTFYWDPSRVGGRVNYLYGICGTGSLYINGGSAVEIITNSFSPKTLFGGTNDFRPNAGINTIMIEVSGSTANACWFESYWVPPYEVSVGQDFGGKYFIGSDSSWSFVKV
jgi:hypothetical protein